MNAKYSWLLGNLLLVLAGSAHAATNNPATDWFRDARYGVFMHFLPGNAQGLERVKAFDTDALAGQLASMGANYFVLTLGQNSGYFNAPNAVYDRYTGYAAGERCAARDLPLALHASLRAKGIRLMLYLPCQAPNRDARAQKAFGLAAGPQDQPLDLAFAAKWAAVIQEWADRYGDKVSGWWFDGGYAHIGFNNAIADIYAKAVKHGNPSAIVTFNPGVKLVRHTQAEDYTAGELNEPFQVLPAGRWVAGSQWHALTYLGNTWGQRNTRFPGEQWAKWVAAATAKEGVVTLDMGPNYDPQAGPIGALAAAQVEQVKAIQAALPARPTAAAPRRLRRANSFLGIHFDFHAGADCTEIGKNTTRAMIEKVIDQVHPDYIQIDCKGHPGLSSYPTRAGNPAPGFVGDPLRLWRQVTAERGVALYMHYSGVWDSEAIRQHPDWAVIDANGGTNKNATSFFGPYADRLLIPQLRELAGEYGVDGAWVDGECWASQPDYGTAALDAFRTTTGIQDVPRKPGEPRWFEFLEFQREAYRGYLRHYLAEVKRTHPEMQLCSNWAFTDHMPEAVSAPVDWISGDYSPQDSVNSARLSARYLARQGKPWDLMAWGFTIAGEKLRGSNYKPIAQLQREAAAVLALGGGFQAYYTQRRDGSIREECLPTMAEVAQFCRARQAFCHRALPVPQVALLYSTEAHYREVNGLFPRDLSRIAGTLQALLESQQSVEVVSEHHLAGRMAEYPLIVIPELTYLEASFRQELMAYARAGGSLLLVGPRTTALFAAELGATMEGQLSPAPRYLAREGAWALTKGSVQAATIPNGRTIGRLHATNDLKAPSLPAASLVKVGRGQVAATSFAFSQGYLAERSPVARGFLNDLARQLFPRPMVEVQGSAAVDLSVNRLNGRLAINLVNTAGPHADQQKPLHDTIPVVGPLDLTLRLPQKPARITVEPGAQPMKFTWSKGEARLTLPRLEIHSVLLVQ